ncbi:lipoyl(octanoyl) transferase LipB [Lysobacter pythonis]|uniref:Octanoyltransferase n=1 Tax=Solilutibacter pythonis TaxID=2483112 RepID=A0A3M2HL69_9GAMM|nr:lipoyl(octanoyl) transferase LipB [Lysobacter pythonis]RMH89095.1 lipoyl(octanoyl) transferase LipB [Lysobacter pythonis]
MDDLSPPSPASSGADGRAAPAAHPRHARVRDLGRQPYAPVWRAMQGFTDARDATTPDEFWFVEHDPVFTLGQAGREEHVLMPGDIPVIHVDRGGQVTYHGPGQIVVYPLLDLKRLKIGVRDYVCRIEQAIIDTLGEWNILAARREGAPGVYVGGAKIAALGIRVRRGCSFHGLAFNIAMDLAPFRRINPCGYAGLKVVSMADLGGPGGMAPVKPVLLAELAKQFGLAPEAAPPPDLAALAALRKAV